MSKQLTNTILMVRPAAFQFNEETSLSNVHQSRPEGLTKAEVLAQAQKEFDEAVATLRGKGVEVIVIEDTAQPEKPDAVFPNNWVTFQQDRKVVLFPMNAENRRIERRPEIIDGLKEQGYVVEEVIDMATAAEANEVFLEGTGSMVIDHEHQLIYACLSPRTDKALLEQYASMRGYEAVSFTALETDNSEIYHTNVLMCMGQHFVVICLDAIIDSDEEGMLLDHFARTGKKVVAISHAQMNQYAGNMLEVLNDKGEHLLVMSQSAYGSLIEGQRKALEAFAELVPVQIPTIETLGGGSARCMMAEMFLEKQ